MFKSGKICPRCQTGRLKNWTELTSDEKFVAERLPQTEDGLLKERRTHLFCALCWFETMPSEEKV